MSQACYHAHHQYDGPSPAAGPEYATWDGLEAFATTHVLETHARRELEGIEALGWHDEPSKTETYRQKYAQNLRGDLKKIRVVATEAIVDEDIFGLETEALASPPGSFDFDSNDAKTEAFVEWLDEQVENNILGEYGESRYIHAAYERALKDTDVDIRQAGITPPEVDPETSMNVGVHEDQLEQIYTRNFAALEGFTDDLGQEISRELADGFAAGENPRAIAGRIEGIIGKMDSGVPRGAMARATTIARTEVMNSHHQGALTRYDEAGIDQVEPVLSADACDLCQDLLAGAPYDREDARSLLPRHPNCRCAWKIAPAA